MSVPDLASGGPPPREPAQDTQARPHDSVAGHPAKKRSFKKKKPNWALIHKSPLPLEVHPLPAFHPTHPISLLGFAYAYLSQLLWKPISHSELRYTGLFIPETRAVHVTNPKHARALWEMGFFGKGTLSRSEMSWTEREKARLLAKRAGGGGTAEENTNARREKRKLFKLERARAEAEKIERQRLVEEGKLDPSVLEIEVTGVEDEAAQVTVEAAPRPLSETMPTPAVTNAPLKSNNLGVVDDEEAELTPDFENQEHLQLTLEEAFFLSYGLGVLDVLPANFSTAPIAGHDLLQTCSAHGYFPAKKGFLDHKIRPDDHFMINYVVYHHFRSLGWVVRQGVKFSVDYLLYYRGPVFSHAEFAVIILPTYTDPYWSTSQGQQERRVKDNHNWWWIHCVNRVQSQALKTLVLVYVDVPSPFEGEKKDIGALLRSYKVREFIVRRWTPNRSRD